jgi:hypothetical protein
MISAPIPCRFAGDDAPGAPQIWACRWNTDCLGDSPEAARQRARDQARTALRALLADTFQLPAAAILLDDQRGSRVHAWLVDGTPPPAGWHTLGLSISHADSVALLAVRPAGPVGVDLTVLPPRWAASHGDALRLQAALYLGPEHPTALADTDRALCPDRLVSCFAQYWAELEAGLKCLEQPLMEWSPALAQRLSACRTAALVLPGAIRGLLAAPSAAAVAWCDGA